MRDSDQRRDADPEDGQATSDEILDEAMETLESMTAFDGTPDRDSVAESFFDFGYLEDEQVERYWLNRPYAYATVLYDEASKTRYYNLTEPVLDETT
ncbi:MAG: type II secretion system protein, partial [Halobacteriales archaeon]